MSKEKAVQLTIRRKDVRTKVQARQMLRWLKGVTKDLEDEIGGLWMVKQKDYSPIFRFSLMK